MPARDYRDLIVWKKAFELAITIYRETAHFPKEQKYGLTSQLRRAGVSIPSILLREKVDSPRNFAAIFNLHLDH
jgi:four helix bundle protein